MTSLYESARNQVDDLDWRQRAFCARQLPDLMFPTAGDKAAVRRAKQTCAPCPVAEPCLALALSQPRQHGIAAGLTAHQRREILRRRRDRERLDGVSSAVPALIGSTVRATTQNMTTATGFAPLPPSAPVPPSHITGDTRMVPTSTGAASPCTRDTPHLQEVSA